MVDLAGASRARSERRGDGMEMGTRNLTDQGARLYGETLLRVAVNPRARSFEGLVRVLGFLPPVGRA